ncbi:MAG TPA: hypothetical protein DEF47_00755 [Herpetosiphon sp.]|uniref:Uncharacterized protein n=1 Tax=Herpetosiphon aurantiacus (strain ATCC 23779 / DSM 785 / 114-95) TaxID=316274 RepID=A9B231_HERA2|nr:hypothetical protein [Herpetosiphon sp.]ABX07381.1 hypothetical protein Haur_4750 [Herpetosiphon aurantiacus DSM 785]HBW48418.1 hypothetical protein [Herpetosiphon sp.]
MSQPQMPPQGSFQLPPHSNYPGTPTNQQAGGSKAKALLIGLGAVVLGAIVWGLLAYFTERIFVYVAILIGVGISYAMISPLRKPVAKPVLFSLVIPAILFTLLSLELGNLITIIIFLRREIDIPLGEAISYSLEAFFSAEWLKSQDHILTIVFGVLGAGYGFYNMLKRS